MAKLPEKQRHLSVAALLLVLTVQCVRAQPLSTGAQVSASWTSSSAAGAAGVILGVSTSGYSTVGVSFVASGTITGGAVTFEVTAASDGNSGWVPLSCVEMSSSGTFDATYTLTGANIMWQCAVAGANAFRVRLSTAISGTGTALFTAQGTAASARARGTGGGGGAATPGTAGSQTVYCEQTNQVSPTTGSYQSLVGTGAGSNSITVNVAGGVVHVYAAGLIQTGAVGASVNFELTAGAATWSTDGPGTIPLSQTNMPWACDFWYVIRTAGTSGTAIARGSCFVGGTSNSYNFGTVQGISTTTAAVNTTIAQTFTIQANMQTNTGNSLVCDVLHMSSI